MKKTWEVKRVVVEYYHVSAETRQEAKDNTEDPYAIEIRSETVKRLNTSPVKGGKSIF
jgi:hypothetical protein